VQGNARQASLSVSKVLDYNSLLVLGARPWRRCIGIRLLLPATRHRRQAVAYSWDLEEATVCLVFIEEVSANGTRCAAALPQMMLGYPCGDWQHHLSGSEFLKTVPKIFFGKAEKVCNAGLHPST